MWPSEDVETDVRGFSEVVLESPADSANFTPLTSTSTPAVGFGHAQPKEAAMPTPTAAVSFETTEGTQTELRTGGEEVPQAVTPSSVSDQPPSTSNSAAKKSKIGVPWSKKNKHTSQREVTLSNADEHSPPHKQRKKGPASFWDVLKPRSSKAKSTSALPESHRLCGGADKTNIDAIFTEIKEADSFQPSTISRKVTMIHAAAEATASRGHHEPSKPTKKKPIMTKKSSAAKIPMLKLENERDWVVQDYTDHAELLKIEGAKLKHNLHVRSCTGINLKVEDKVNNVIIESCKSANVILSGLISSVELIHCEKVKVQVLGSCPSVNMDNCSGVTLFIGKEGRNVSVTASKSCDMNVSFPVDDAEEEWIEVPIPQQFVHAINKDNKIDSRVSDLYR